MTKRRTSLAALDALFIYGTLLDDEVRSILFGREVPMRTAILPDYSLFRTPGEHYFHAERTPGAKLEGAVIGLEPAELWTADQFEEIPSYERARVTISLDNGAAQAWAYTRTAPVRSAVNDPRLSELDVEEVRMEARQLVQQRGNDEFFDAWLFFPAVMAGHGVGETTVAPNATMSAVLCEYDRLVREEYESPLAVSLRRLPFGPVMVALTGEVKALQAAQVACTYSGDKMESAGAPAVVTVAMPALAIPAGCLAESVVNGTIGLEGIPVAQWLRARELESTGKARIVLFSQRALSPEKRCLLLAAEDTEKNQQVSSRAIHAAADIDLAQYARARIHASSRVLVEEWAPPEWRWEERAPRELLTTFVVELLQMQEATLSHAVEEMDRLRNPGTEEMTAIRSKFFSSILFWDVRNFRFPTMQALIDGISLAFGMNDLRHLFDRKKRHFEELVEFRDRERREQENIRLSRFGAVLTFLLAAGFFHEFVSTLSGNVLGALWTWVLSLALTLAFALPVWKWAAGPQKSLLASLRRRNDNDRARARSAD